MTGTGNLPTQPNSPGLQVALDAIRSSLLNALGELLHTYGKWIALAAPFLICLLVLEWVVKAVFSGGKLMQDRAAMHDDLDVMGLNASGFYRPIREGWN